MNSIRGDVSLEEVRFLVAVRMKAIDTHEADDPFLESEYQVNDYDSNPTCSAFFVANSQQKILIGSSRHCFAFNEERLCKEKKLRIQAFATGDMGYCSKILVSSEKSDFFIFEADFGEKNDEVKKESYGLNLAYIQRIFNPRELEVFGFPSDELRKKSATASRNCHSFSMDFDPNYSLFANNSHIEYLAKNSTPPASVTADYKNNLAKIYKHTFFVKHNCSIYGGNSGGPAIIKGTRTVLGIPETYVPSSATYSSKHYGLLESINTLYKERPKLFEENKIHLMIIDDDKEEVSSPSSPESKYAPITQGVHNIIFKN